MKRVTVKFWGVIQSNKTVELEKNHIFHSPFHI